MPTDGGPDAPLLDRVRTAARALEACPPGPARTAGAALLDHIRAAIADRDLAKAEELVTALETLLTPPPTPAGPVVQLEEGDLGLPPPKPKRRRPLREYRGPAPPPAPSAAVPSVAPAAPVGPVPAEPVPPAAPVAAATVPPEAAAEPLPLVWGVIPERVGKYLRFSRTTRVRLMVSAILGLGFMVVVGLAAHWRLLYGIDTPGIYTPQDFLWRPSVDVALPSFLALLDGSNPYVTLYLQLGIEAAAISYCVQLLTGAFARGTFRGTAVIAIEALAAMLYLANPYILSFGNTSLYSNVLVSNAAFIAFLAMLVQLLWEVRHGLPVSRSKALLMGLAIGLSNPYAFPNLLRIQAMILLVLVLAFVYLLLTVARTPKLAGADPHPLGRTILRFVVYTLPPAVLLLAFPLWTTTETYLGPHGPLKSIIASQPFLQVTEHNTFPMVLRLLGKGTLHIFAYSSQLNGTGLVAISSWAWPVLALGFPLVIVLFTRRPAFLTWKTVGILELFAWVALAWSAGSNPPFGIVVGPIIKAAPVLLAAFPNYYPEYQVLSVIYPILAAASIVWIGSAVSMEVATMMKEYAARPESPPSGGSLAPPSSFPPTQVASMSGRVVVVLLAILLLLVALPVSTGQSLAPSGRVAPGGFVVPSEYGTLRTILNENPGTDLLLPGVQSHVQTDWGYDGASSWYTLWNYPVEVIQPDYYGPFEIQVPKTASLYANLTAPLLPSGSPTNFSNSLGPVRQYGNSSGSLTLGWNLGTAANWTGVTWISLTLRPSNPGLFEEQVLAGNVETGIAWLQGSVRHVGWFDAAMEPNSNLSLPGNGNVVLSMLAPYPTIGQVNLGSVIGVELRVYGVSSIQQLTASVLGAFHWSANQLNSGWDKAILNAGVHTLLTDTNLINGTNAPVAYGLEVAQLAVGLGYATEIWHSADLTVYVVKGS